MQNFSIDGNDKPQTLGGSFIFSIITAFSLFAVGYWLLPPIRMVMYTLINFIPGPSQGIAAGTAATFFTIMKFSLIALMFISAIYWIIWLLKKTVREYLG